MKTQKPIMYQVWSTHRPGISNNRVIGGTVQAMQVGNTPVDPQAPLPPGTRLEQLRWMQPLLAKVKARAPVVVTVPGAAGRTYEVTTYSDGRKMCTCPGYTYRRTCKHLAG